MQTCELSFLASDLDDGQERFDCEREILDGSNKCILHSKQSDKDEEAFWAALIEHQKDHGLNFQKVVFPGGFSFEGTFEEKANFAGATFDEAVFQGANFKGGANFTDATFEGTANFWGAWFSGVTTFREATFKDRALFLQAEFMDRARFRNATFDGIADFLDVNFWERADFFGATFEESARSDGSFEAENEAQFVEAEFSYSKFGDEATFHGQSEKNRMFAGGRVSFVNVTVAPDANLHFRYADLSQCRFLRTDLRKIEFTGVKWCEAVSSDGRYFNECFRRVGLYDEVYEQSQDYDNEYENKEDSESTSSWFEIERLYRQLKRNYEERGDFPRAGDFHIGEKVARRQNPQTHWGAWLLLTAYRALSKYGERALPAFIWLVSLVLGCAVGYLAMGGVTDSVWLTSWGLHDWWEALVLSSEATLFPVRSAGFHKIGPRALNLVQRGLSPILIALLALALRQRVKR